MSALTRRLRRNSLWKLSGDGSRILLALNLLVARRIATDKAATESLA